MVLHTLCLRLVYPHSGLSHCLVQVTHALALDQKGKLDVDWGERHRPPVPPNQWDRALLSVRNLKSAAFKWGGSTISKDQPPWSITQKGSKISRGTDVVGCFVKGWEGRFPVPPLHCL